VRVEAVDADRHGLAGALPVDVVQRLDDVLARLFFVGRRHGVFAVEEDVVGSAGQRLVDHRRVGAGNSQLTALQTLLTKRVKGKAHRDISSFYACDAIGRSPAKASPCAWHEMKKAAPG
jgi:hypothetical protein